MNNNFRAITNEDLIRKYDLDKLKTDRKRISTIDNKLTYTDGVLVNFVEQTTQDIENIQDQLDGNITSWFYEGVPTLNNEPAVNWTTTTLKDEHLGDLYYDTDAGTAYRFIYDGDNQIYKWNLLQDDAAAQALAIARAAQDTADSKRRIFVVQPTPPYDVGDVWWNNNDNELYRCIIAETESGSFHSSDWINSLKYTDDSTAIRLVGDLRDDVVEGYCTKTELTETSNSINASVKALRVITDSKHQIFEETPTPPYNIDDYYIDKTNQEVYKCITAKEEGQSYSSADWVLDLELTEYVAQAGVEIFEDAINMEVKKKVGDNEIISKINLSPEQIDILSDKINLDGSNIVLNGTRGITISSPNFNVDSSGNVTCNNLYGTNANISGTINATSGTIGGAVIQNNTLKISNINIDTINGDKVQGGTLSGYNVNITNVSGDGINRGTLNGNNVSITNLSASNIIGGSLTAGQINYQYYAGGQNFFRCGPGYANSPYVSALNVAYGHGGISFRNSDAASSPGSEIGYIKVVESNGNVRMYGNNGVSIQSGGTTYVDGSNGVNVAGVRFYSNYIHIGSLISGEDREINIGEHYINAGRGGQIDMHTSSGGNLVLYGGGKVRAGGNSSSNNVATSSSGPSSRNVKKNLKNIKQDYKDIYEDLKDINMYTYDYKYNGIKDNPSDYGFIIDEIEDTKTLSKYFRNYDTKLYLDHNKVVTQSYSDEDMEKYDSLDIKEWERDAYIKGLFITIKSLQNEIEELKDEVKSLKERNGAE